MPTFLLPVQQIRQAPPGAEPVFIDEDLQPKRRPKGLIRRLHRWAGALAALFVVALATTGLLLNHPSLLGAPPPRTTALAVDPQNPAHLLKGTPSGLFASEDGGETWEEVPVDAEEVSDVAFSHDRPGRVYALFKQFGLIRSDDGGRVWEPVSLPFTPAQQGIALLRASPGPGDAVTLITSVGVFYRPAPGKPWSWKERRSEDLRTVIHQIHTGYFFSRHAVYLSDFAACALVFLTVTGFLLWGRKNGRAKNRE
ncbi:MAG: hypothetical protein A3F84_03440 [Candidatus Handelsmanbacteria bacterium RIFCSPLOWO2_12_FULL_64_10]|uniref:Photosynthesis system II assembly factor Ycf48/Hcf136-like domain-containing protein n=1 Tax=Handelsmanbacteria sp. (strain RIFCSPLOWO2_12_FULL_64_10) TaxID=1817868 RepID=A0A1F6CCR4_HANXR|nr:MAG: hypothetical protein A3F84_03440 [Candidatus Handelsmanbacteria bacterium RIFCSPLOWO2_12_FULL_64_10]